jgi:hypothetical protein
MRIASGTIRNGKVELDDELPDGTTVVILVHEGDGTLKVWPGDEAKLAAAIDAVRKKVCG